MILSKANLSRIPKRDTVFSSDHIFNLPEKVLQFGTGVLLRGLPDYFIDKANRNGVFNGRVAVIKSTNGDTNEFDKQDSLYTLCIRGIADGKMVKENIISSAISRVIAADQHWNSILNIAASADLELIVSNTTEVGIQYVEESIFQNPPNSFPAKLLAVLYHRFQTFKGASTSGLVIVATELIPDNGKKLREIVQQLAVFNQLNQEFIFWLQNHNQFCNSLVDRIVPGKPDAQTLIALQDELGYTDHLLTMCEPYALWAIEGDERVAKVMTFATIDPGLIIAPDIEIYRELKVRLLNGTHTLASGIAFLTSIDTVKDAMQCDALSAYIDQLMLTEIAPAIPYQISESQSSAFANIVKDRFANPAIAHLWTNITLQYSMKLKIRILPVLLNHYKLFDHVPQHIAFGFAAYLTFMKVEEHQDEQYFGKLNGKNYLINDDSAAYFYQKLQNGKSSYPLNVLNDDAFWKTNLQLLDGFIPAVEKYYHTIEKRGIKTALNQLTIAKLDLQN